MQKLIWKNSNNEIVDLTGGNFGITNWEGFSNTELNIQSQQVPFQDGSVYLDGLLSDRELSVTLAINDNGSLERRYELRRLLIKILNPKLNEGYLIYKNDFIEKRIKCISRLPIFENHNSNDVGTLKANLSWVACEPYWEDLEETEITSQAGKRFNVENAGDLPISFNVDFLGLNLKQPRIINYTSGKKIQLNKEYSQSISINTNAGHKEVNEMNLALKSVLGNYRLNDVSYSESLNTFVGVGQGIILTSSDWEKFNYIPVDFVFNSVIYVEKKNLFVAIGFNSSHSEGVIFTSVDGINWKNKIFESIHPYDICYSENLDLFVIVGVNYIATSPDLENWTQQEFPAEILTPNPNTRQLYGICYSEEKNLFVAVGRNTYDSTKNCILITSEDGENWTNQVPNDVYARFDLKDVSYSEKYEKFICASYIGGIFTSEDGTTWDMTSPDFVASRQLNKICKSNSKIFCFGYANVISDDGENWTELTTRYECGTYSKTLDLFVGQTSLLILGSSKDGITWNELNNNYDFVSGCYCEKLNVSILLARQNYVQISLNGENWQQKLITNNSQYIFTAINWIDSENKFFAFGENYTTRKGILFTSEDGENWIEEDFDTSNDDYIINSIIENDGTLVAVGTKNDIELILTSDDGGENWTERTAPTQSFNYNLRKIIYFKNSFIAIGNDYDEFKGIIISSEDGENWTTLLIKDYLITSITSSSSLLVAVGGKSYSENNPYSITSEDGENWTEDIISSLSYFEPLSIGYSKELNLFLTFDTNIVEISSDGINFTILKNFGFSLLPFSNSHSEVMFDSNKNIFVLGGGNKIIFETEFQANKNAISDLTVDSNMNMKIEIGNNEFLISSEDNNFIFNLKYRQKYIGV